VRKRHVQLELLNQAGTKEKSATGGKRRRAGRPPKGKRAGSPHKRREAFKASQPIHVVLRIEKVMGNLRRRDMYRAVRGATMTVAVRDDFRIIHLSIQRTHIHLLVETENRIALTRGMQGFQISAAKHMNAALKWEKRRRGRVFTDRYHAEVIRTPRQARHVLAYVLNNWRKHREDVGRKWNVDPFSSGCSFTGWEALERQPFMWKLPPTYDAMIVWFPKTWLLTQGWLKYGRIGFHEVPGSREKLPARRPHTAAAELADA
jgi:REP element-mobilizing transposase RayT